MTYSERIGGDRIKPGSIGATEVDLTGIATLGNVQEFTDLKAFSDGVEVKDSNLEVTQTGSPEALVSLNSNGQVTFSDGVAVPVVSLLYDTFNAGILVNSPVRFADAEYHENLAHYSPNATIVFDLQTSTTHAAILASQLAPGGPIYELNVSGGQRWGVQGSGYDTELYRSNPDELTLDDSLIVDIDLTVNGNVALGDAITDLIGLYGAAAVAQAAAIAAPSAASAGYVQAEAQSAVDAINDIRAALSGIGITA